MIAPGTRFRMRPLVRGDIPGIARWYEEVDDLAVFHRQLPLPVSAEALEAHLGDSLTAAEPRRSYWFAIDDQEGSLVGFGGIEDITYVHGDAVTPLFIAPPARRRGVGLRARAILLDLAFDQLRLERITSLHRVDNAASHRINQACGLIEEGRIRRGWFSSGEYVDLLLFGILADEWRARRSTLRREIGAETVVILGTRPWGRWSWPQSPAPTADETDE